jgi:N-acetylmuramoyl-L-alanine amidase
LTRDEEARALATEAYRQALAEGIAEGIVRYVRR